MCGIVGYVGKKKALPILLDGLAKLEYRGYDSAGVAMINKTEIEVRKAKGRLTELKNLVENDQALEGGTGIGHTRWATHGKPSVINAHPHTSPDGKIAIVHNGIVENHAEIREELLKAGYSFVSETDTEVAVLLIHYYYKGDPLRAIAAACGKIRGSYAFAIIFSDFPDKLYVARWDSPLLVSKGYAASDAIALAGKCEDAAYLKNGDIAEVSENSVRIFDRALLPVERPFLPLAIKAEQVGKGNYSSFMAKEIEEQPDVIRRTVCRRIHGGSIDFPEINNFDGVYLNGINKIFITACGSAYHVGLSGKYFFESIAKIPTEVEIASELRSRDPLIPSGTLFIVISQSGETADTLAALRLAKSKNARTLAIVNVKGSTIAREADYVIFTEAGPEIAVATTKAYTAQLGILELLSIHFAYTKGLITESQSEKILNQMISVPDTIAEAISKSEDCRNVADTLKSVQSMFFIGRGLDWYTALEGSLKLKEISYIHSETYAAGELKHGTISLVEEGTPIVVLATQPNLYDKMAVAAAEVKCRGAKVIAVTPNDNTKLREIADYVLTVPDSSPLFAPFGAVCLLQITACFCAEARGYDVDKPRNLAKSVTVE
ncbi:MAG: glutamine--fructose-6-phosphate transaminase (isomerizing) [Clostridia bacterium]|nr:glutamine--fructose-6-phosphate transaminase (isomerizing) [Clostridia bacterium]